MTYFPTIEAIEAAAQKLSGIVQKTLLMHNLLGSEKYGANIFFKREDLQVVRSYKLRGAYYKISTLSESEKSKGVVCASAGNHAQGVAYACRRLGIKGTIFMPLPTPKQKVNQVAFFGKEWVEIILEGDTFDDAYASAQKFCDAGNQVFVHPFDDPRIIEGQGTVALEILEQSESPIDILLLPVGGGGLAAGVSTVFKLLSPNTQIIAVEPLGAASLKNALEKGENCSLEHIDKFVDGAAVKRIGNLNFEICRRNIDRVLTVAEGKVCSTILELYNLDAIVVEPAGALSIAALEQLGTELKGKNVVCIISGSNNDISRTEEIRERSLLHEGLKHYFIVRFPQRAGALKEFVADVLGPNDDIVHFEYSKKTSREKGPALVGIELKHKDDFEPLLNRMKAKQFFGEYLNDNPELFGYLV
jgi:threonine dehydratase